MADDIPEQQLQRPAEGDLLVLGRGTYGVIKSAVAELQSGGLRVLPAHIRYLRPSPKSAISSEF